MTGSEFQNLLEQLAGEPGAEAVFDRLNPDDLNPDQRRELALFLRTQALLRAGVAGGEAFARRVMAWRGTGEKDLFTSQVMASRARQISSARRWREILPWALAAVASLAALASWWRPLAEGGATRREPTLAVGVLVDEVDATFSANHSPRQSGFPPGSYRLETGLAHVRLVNGTDLVLKAPVAFEIESPMRVRLREGDMRVLVPDTAHGFIVATQGVEYQDLGTEFGVSARQGGASQVHVFDGEVNVLKTDGTMMESVTLGGSLAFADGALSPAPAPGKDQFPTAGEIGRRRWEQVSHTLRQDPDLVAYYSFQRDPADPRRLRDIKAHETAFDGTVQGARWVTGRWPGKDALFFDNDEDHALVEISGRYTRLSVAAWVLLDRFDFPNNAIFASNGWEPGDFHMNLNAQGRLFGGTFGRAVQRQANPDLLKLGVWSLVVMVADEPQKTVRGWINGRRVLSTEIEKTWDIIPGTCRIGGCLSPAEKANPIRTLRGRVDELLIWKRALADDEIRRLYEEGRPSVLEHPSHPPLNPELVPHAADPR